MRIRILFILPLIICFIFHTSCFITFAEEATSTNYRIQYDSINIGGVLATTSNYRLDDTMGELATGISTTTSFQLKAGYQEMHAAYIALSVPSDLTMAPNIKQLSGGQSDGSGQATVTTDSSSGYSLSIKVSTSPALTTVGDSFTDYVPAVAGVPDFTWSIPAANSEFGFTPEGSHLVQKFQDDGSSCNAAAGGDTANVCWYELSTTAETIAQSNSSNQPAGTATTLKFRAESGSSHTQTAGNYQATITLTALAN